jgi:hypothetical protein
MAPAPQSPRSAAAQILVFGAAMGILFVALFAAASSGPCHAVMRHADAVWPLLLLTLNLAGLFACAAFVTAFGSSPRDVDNGPRLRAKRSGGDHRALSLETVPVAIRPSSSCGISRTALSRSIALRSSPLKMAASPFA